ncbi:MAG: hypothetical protein KH155_05740 [Clostridium sp.]|nr:hypothetical protein [Clostridium sp.]
MQAITQWAAGICFAIAAAGICGMLVPQNALGKTFRMLLSVFFLCSVLSPLRSCSQLELPAVDTPPEQLAEEISQQLEEQLTDRIAQQLAEQAELPLTEEQAAQG